VVDEILSERQAGRLQVVIGAHRMKGWQRFFLDDWRAKFWRDGPAGAGGE
jgi:hypothetical protein